MIQANEHVLSHYLSLKCLGQLSDDVSQVFIATSGEKALGDVIQLSIVLDTTKSCIREARYQAYGSLFAIACASHLAQLIEGMPLEKVKQITADSVIDALELPASREHCAFRACDVLQDLIIQTTKNKTDVIVLRKGCIGN